MKRMFPLTLLLIPALSACGAPSPDAPPVVRAAPNGGQTLSTLQLTLSSTSRITAGPGMGSEVQSPAGIRTSYLFEPTGIRMRADLPGSAFPDGEARILLVSPQSGQTRLLLARTNQADQTVPQEQLAQFGQGLAEQTRSLTGLMDPQHPFRKLSGEQFRTLARSAAFDVTGDSGNRIQVTRRTTQNGAQVTLRLNFDQGVGAVTESVVTSVAPTLTTRAVQTLHYVDVQGLPDTAIPYRTESEVTSTLTGAAAQTPVTLPTADAQLPAGQAPTLKPGQYIAQSFSAPPGEGVTDINTRVSTSETVMSDLAVNAVKADFFTPEVK